MIVKSILLWCAFLSFTLAICPLCPLIAGAAVSGGMSTGNTLISVAASSLISLPFMLAFIDGFRPRNMTFEFPKRNQIISPGQYVDLYMNTFGLSSRFHLRTAELYILNASFERVAKVAREREFKVITHVQYQRGIVPQEGFGYFRWKVPHLPKGRYYLKYVSGWTIWQHEGKFSAISKDFIISRKPCHSVCVGLIPKGRSPDSFTTETAPRELQFMYPHFNGTQQAISDFIDGVMDAPENTVRNLAKAIKSPKSVSNSIKDPIKGIQSLMDDWENQFERNPFRATGQAVGAALELYGASALIYNRINHKSGACPGGKCMLGPKPVVVNIQGPTCPACTKTIGNGLKNAGILNFQFTDIENGSVNMILYDYDKQKLGELGDLISEIGFEMRPYRFDSVEEGDDDTKGHIKDDPKPQNIQG